MSDALRAADPHETAMYIVQEKYKAEHPYKTALFGPPDYKDIQKDPELLALYNENFEKLSKAKADDQPCDTTLLECPLKIHQVKKDNPNCKLSSLKITKPKRSFERVITESTETASSGQEANVLEVVGGQWNTIPEIDLKLEGLIHNCSSHEPQNGKFRHWRINNLKDENIVLDDTTAKLKTPSEFQLLVLPWNPKIKIYPIAATTCSQSLLGVVKVYPDIDVSLKITYKRGESHKAKRETTLELKNDGKPKGKVDAVSTTRKYEVVEVSKNLVIEASITQSGEKINFQQTYGSLITRIKDIETLYTGSVTVLEAITKGKKKTSRSAEKRENKGREKTLNDNYSKELEKNKEQNKDLVKSEDRDSNGVTFPSISFSVGGKWEEQPGQYFCEFNGYIEVAADPLIEFNVKEDISEYILKTFPVGAAVSWLKKFLYELGAEALAVYIIIKTPVKGSLRFYPKKWEDCKVEGKISGKIEIAVEAVALKFTKEKPVPFKSDYCITVKVDVSIGGKSGIQADAAIEYTKKVKVKFIGSLLPGIVYLNSIVDASTGECKPKKPYEPPKKMKVDDVTKKPVETSTPGIELTLWTAKEAFNKSFDF
jgi:hypothetical protein